MRGLDRYKSMLLTVLLMMKLYVRNVWVIKNLSICIDLILSVLSEMHSSVKIQTVSILRVQNKNLLENFFCLVGPSLSPLIISSFARAIVVIKLGMLVFQILCCLVTNLVPETHTDIQTTNEHVAEQGRAGPMSKPRDGCLSNSNDGLRSH